MPNRVRKSFDSLSFDCILLLLLILMSVFDFVDFCCCIVAVRGRSPKELLEYLFLMWDSLNVSSVDVDSCV